MLVVWEISSSLLQFYPHKRLSNVGGRVYADAPVDLNDSFMQTRLEKLSDPGRGLMISLADIMGVTRVDIEPYGVSLSKSPAYEWGEIQPVAELALSYYLGECEFVAKEDKKSKAANPEPDPQPSGDTPSET